MNDYLKTIPVTLSISLLALLAFAFPSLSAALEYSTSTIPIDQPLQVVGCHLLHWSSDHLFWDLAMFAMLGAICERLSRRTYLWVLAIAAFVIPPIVGACYPAIETYRGLSGLDTALFGMATVSIGLQRWREGDKSGVWVYFGLLAGMVCKIGHELIFGNTFFVESSHFVPVPMAHVVGAMLGVLAGLRIGGTKVWPGIARLNTNHVNATQARGASE